MTGEGEGEFPHDRSDQDRPQTAGPEPEWPEANLDVSTGSENAALEPLDTVAAPDRGELGNADLEPAPRPYVTRTPNLADALLFALMVLFGLLIITAACGVALHFHWFGLRSFTQIQTSTRIALGTQFALYGIALACAVPFFRMAWGKGYFAGLHWHGDTAWHLRYWLVGIALLCNVLAAVGNWLLPFPEHAPVDRMFSTTADAWLMMAFGVLVAPLFEEMIFRGFLLPAMATAWDWSQEQITHTEPRPLDGKGNPRWSTGATVFSAMLVSAPFAWMHSEQVAKAWGPLLLLYCVSLILCAVRLATRSLAASTLVHSAYNGMLFAVMLFQTDGFRHLDKL